MIENVDTTLIMCSTCEARVSAHIIASKEGLDKEATVPCRVLFLECSSCKSILLGYTELTRMGYEDWDFPDPERVWPNPKNSISWKVPELVRTSIEEARRCFDAHAYSACVVMCGRTLEFVCKEHGVKNWQLKKGLKELKDKGIIDGRLYEWGEALRESRNISAHATDTKVFRNDAKDILDFAIAICDYVYVLADKYESFKKRQLKK